MELAGLHVEDWNTRSLAGVYGLDVSEDPPIWIVIVREGPGFWVPHALFGLQTALSFAHEALTYPGVQAVVSLRLHTEE
jgi:hypothetical protein